MNRFAHAYITIAITACTLVAACNRESPPAGPRFTGRLLLLSGDNINESDLVELTPSPTGTSYHVSVVTRGVFEASPNPEQTHLLYATKAEIQLRDLNTGTARSLIKGQSFCLAWSPDGKRFSYKQKSAQGNASKLFVSDLDGKAKLIWDDPNDATLGSQTASSGSAATAASCPQWIAADRIVFDRLIGASPKQKTAGEVLKPNTTTMAILSDSVKLVDTPKKWTIEAVCPSRTTAFLRSQDQDQLLIAREVDRFNTLNPSPGPCSGCRFIGFAARSCVPFFIEQSLSTSTELFSLNPTSWQKQRGSTISRTFSLSAKMLIKSSARQMVVGDGPSTLLLIDTESGEVASFFPEGGGPTPNDGRPRFPRPIVWIEK